MRRFSFIEPVGILKAWTAKVRMKRARMTATMIDSRYSRPTDFLKVGAGRRGLLVHGRILADSGREPGRAAARAG